MDDIVKVRIATVAIETLFLHGLPSMVKMMNTLNDKEKVTLEDIQELTKNMKKSESYFE